MSEAATIRDLFDGLRAASGGPDADRFRVASLPGNPRHRIGADTRGRPTLLLQLEGDHGGEQYPLRLENVALRYGVASKVSDKSGSERTETFTILQCLSDDRGLQDHFLTVASVLVDTLPECPDLTDVSERVTSLVRLFESVSSRGIQSAQGLWGELYVLWRATDVGECLEAWYSEVDETFDLVAGRERVEIKTYSGPVRSHLFSHRQLHPPEGTTAVVASLQVERSAGGVSIGTVMARIIGRAGLSGDDELHFHEQVARRLGDEYGSAIHRGFDLELANDTYRYYCPELIPKLDRELPVGVSSAQYRSDLSRIEPSAVPDGENLFPFIRARPL